MLIIKPECCFLTADNVHFLSYTFVSQQLNGCLTQVGVTWGLMEAPVIPQERHIFLPVIVFLGPETMRPDQSGGAQPVWQHRWLNTPDKAVLWATIGPLCFPFPGITAADKAWI